MTSICSERQGQGTRCLWLSCSPLLVGSLPKPGAATMLTPAEGAGTTADHWRPTHLQCQLHLLCRCWNCWHRILLTLASSMSPGDFNEIALFSFTGCLQPWNLGRRMLGVANTGQYWELSLPSGSVLMSWNPICVLWLSLPSGWVSSQENSGLFWETILTRLSHPLLAVLKYVWVPSA